MSIMEELTVYQEEIGEEQSEASVVRAAHGVAVPPIRSLTRDLLVWVASRPRGYAEAMGAWRTSCPRFSIWEDALDEGLIRLEHETGRALSDAVVVLTPRGHSLLEGA